MLARIDRRTVLSERDAIVVALAKAGLGPRAIAKRSGLRAGLVGTILFKARKRDGSVPRFNSKGAEITEAAPAKAIGFKLDAETAALVHAAAVKRGLAAAQLAREIVLAVIGDDLVAAVLDE